MMIDRNFLKNDDRSQKETILGIMNSCLKLIEKLEEKEILSQEEVDNIVPNVFKIMRKRERGEIRPWK